MATKSSTMEENIIFDDMITCKICREHFDDPRRLPCMHTYCFRCISTEALRTKGDFTCPMNDGTTIQRNQVGSLPVNPVIRDMVESLSKIVSITLKNPDSEESNDSDSIDNGLEPDVPGNPHVFIQNMIFIRFLPTNMPEELLFDKLQNVFITVGEIKVITRKNFAK